MLAAVLFTPVGWHKQEPLNYVVYVVSQLRTLSFYSYLHILQPESHTDCLSNLKKVASRNFGAMSPSTEPEDQISQRISEINSHYKNYGIGALAQAYEEFKKEVSRAEAAAYKGEAGSIVLERIKDLENLFATVTGNDVKELSMFMKDSEALKRTAEFASINAEHIRFGDLGGALTHKEFVSAVKKFMNPDADFGGDEDTTLRGTPEERANERFNSFDWHKLGQIFYLQCKVAVPSHFLYGPLATKRRKAAPRARTVDDTVSFRDKTTAQKVTATDIQEDPEQSTSHMVRTVYGVLSEHDERVNLFQFFINPHSFAQSVENLFYTSFLVRDGKIKMDVDEEGVPYVEIPDYNNEIDVESAPVSHHIATFDMLTWKVLIENFHITELFIPHRDVEEDTFSHDEG